jgi:hypothetical protein
VGTLTWIAPGETHHWDYGWDDFRPDAMCIAGPDLDRNGSAGAIVWATAQGKRMRIDAGPTRHEFHVTIRSDGPETALYNLQVVTFP